MSGFIPISHEERRSMLAEVGAPEPEHLFDTIPGSLRLTDLPCCPELGKALSEMQISRELRNLAAMNVAAAENICFLGAGAYDHYQPAAIRHLLLRQEFMTAYTPYQPEISQGTLQGIFEFQSLICRLTGLQVANSSMYDGASAAAEALLLACRVTGRRKVLVCGLVHPQTCQVVRTYLEASGMQVLLLPAAPDGTCADLLASLPSEQDTAAILVQSPNFHGLVEDLAIAAAAAHKAGALAIASCDPISLAVLEPPGSLGVDMAVGEIQPLGIPMSFGGPYGGYFAAREELLRSMPGRIAGETTDRYGRRAFVLTIQAREQHIRREKATSNICTNQALCALAATMYLSLLGDRGLREVAVQSTRKACRLRSLLLAGGWFESVHQKPFFREFAVRLDPGQWPQPLDNQIALLNRWLAGHGIIGGYDLGQADPASPWNGCWLLSVTEKRAQGDLERLIALIGQYRAERRFPA